MTPTTPNRNVVVRDERRAHERTKKNMKKMKKPSSLSLTLSLSLSLFRALISITESAVVLNKKSVQKREEKKCNDVL